MLVGLSRLILNCSVGLRDAVKCNAHGMLMAMALSLASFAAVDSALAQQNCVTNAGLSGVGISPRDLACGAGSSASGSATAGATAYGTSATAGQGDTSIGDSAGGVFGGFAVGTVSVGNNANNVPGTAPGSYATAIGAGVISGGTITGAQSLFDYSIAIGGGDGVGGVGAIASNFKAIAVGLNSAASGVSSMAIGSGATASGDNAVALGNAVTASGANSFAGGNSSSATGASSVAVGDTAAATGAQATALGPNARALGANSVAIGSGSVATLANTASFGSAGNERRLTNVAAGINPTDAVNMSQISGLTSGFQSQLTGLQAEVNANQREARAGTALALAATGLQYDHRPGKASVATAVANFKGQSGIAVGLGYAVSDRWRVNASFTSAPQVSDFGVVAGASLTLN
jgi:hypothetical protein